MRTSFQLYSRFLCAVLLLVIAVTPLSLGASQPKPVTVVLAVGEEVTIDRLVLRFESIVGDSRCPIDVFCIWEGDGVIRVDARKGDAERVQQTLHTHKAFGDSFVYEGYVIEFTKLDPQPVSGEPIPSEKYRATLRITAKSAVPTEQSTWGKIKDDYK